MCQTFLVLCFMASNHSIKQLCQGEYSTVFNFCLLVVTVTLGLLILLVVAKVLASSVAPLFLGLQWLSAVAVLWNPITGAPVVRGWNMFFQKSPKPLFLP